MNVTKPETGAEVIPRPAASTGTRGRRRLRRIAGCLVGLALGLALLVLFRAPILRALAQGWAVSDAEAAADVVVVLDGNRDVRPFAAAEMFKGGRVASVVVMNARSTPSEKLGAVCNHFDANREVLLRLGVPGSKITGAGADVTSTYEEAIALRQWARESGVRSMIIPTEIFHTRRVRWLFRKVFAGSGVRVDVCALDALGYNAADWWQREQGLIAFQNEVIKYVYYRLKY